MHSETFQNKYNEQPDIKRMQDDRSCVILTTPTSGTTSLWRLVSLITSGLLAPSRITERLSNEGNASHIPDWKPEAKGNLYLYNTSHIINKNLNDKSIRLIVNVRDPRDLVCNQYHWVFVHPHPGTEEEIRSYRDTIKSQGIDDYVLKSDTSIQYRAHRAVAERLEIPMPNKDILLLSYNQLCLGFDELVADIANFFGVDLASVPKDLIERERTINLSKNPAYIGQMWGTIWPGSDIAPGRFKNELKKETIQELERRYSDTLRFLARIEKEKFKYLYAFGVDRLAAEQVVFGKNDNLFLTNDANHVMEQITGAINLPYNVIFSIASTHAARRDYGSKIEKFTYAHAIIPDKAVANRSFLPPEIIFESEGPRPIQQYARAGATAIWNPYYEPELLSSDSEEIFFPKTDTHWNHSGAYRYFKAFVSSKLPKISPLLESMPIRFLQSEQLGDLGNKIMLPAETIKILAPDRGKAQQVFTNGLTNEGCVRWYENLQPLSSEKILILHDSFTLWLMDLISQIFSQSVFIHTTIFDFDFVQRLRPDYVLVLQAERFLLRCPSNGESVLKFVESEEKKKGEINKFQTWLEKKSI